MKRFAFALLVPVLLAVAGEAPQPREPEDAGRGGNMMGGMMNKGMSGVMGGSMKEMSAIHGLLSDHRRFSGP